MGETKQARKQIAYDHIKGKILSCEYEPGSYLNEQSLCEELGLSRTPVRDALSRLEQEGLLVIMPKKGIQVSDLKLGDINRIFEVRLLLEPYALRRYGEKLNREKLEEFRNVMSSVDLHEHNAQYFYDLDDQFHRLIIQAMNNRYLTETYDNIKNLNRRLRVLSGSRVENRIAATSREHIEIISLCLERRWDDAVNALTRHLESSRVASFHLLIGEDEDTF